MHDAQSVRPHAIRQEWREVCERVASQTELTEDLAALTELLKLPLSCCLAVHQVLKEGNWAKADSPMAYIKKAASTQARKMHLAIPHDDDTLECGGGPVVFMDCDKLEQSATGSRLELEYREKVLVREEEAAERGPFWPDDCWTMPQVPDWLAAMMKVRYAENPDEFLAWKLSLERRDWKKLGDKAGLDAWEIRVLEYRSRGVSRDSAMKLQQDEVSRKAIQAAWKRVDRSRMSVLRDCIQKKSLEDVPERFPEDTRKVGEVTENASSYPKPAISGNPLRAAWNSTGGKSREDLGRFLIRYRDAAYGSRR